MRYFTFIVHVNDYPNFVDSFPTTPKYMSYRGETSNELLNKIVPDLKYKYRLIYKLDEAPVIPRNFPIVVYGAYESDDQGLPLGGS